jgi:hypothetical protein
VAPREATKEAANTDQKGSIQVRGLLGPMILSNMLANIMTEFSIKDYAARPRHRSEA